MLKESLNRVKLDSTRFQQAFNIFYAFSSVGRPVQTHRTCGSTKINAWRKSSFVELKLVEVDLYYYLLFVSLVTCVTDETETTGIHSCFYRLIVFISQLCECWLVWVKMHTMRYSSIFTTFLLIFNSFYSKVQGLQICTWRRRTS